MSKLTKCSDCKREISKNAPACPNCGAVQKHTGALNKIVGIIFILWLFSFCLQQYGQNLNTQENIPSNTNTGTPPITGETPAQLWQEKYKSAPEQTAQEIEKDIKAGNFEFAGKLLGYLKPIEDKRITVLTKMLEKEKSNPAPKKQNAQALSQSEIIQASLKSCRSSIKAQLQFPSSYEEALEGGVVNFVENNNTVTHIPFKTKNGMGLDLPQMGQCLTNNRGKVIVAKISNR